MSAKQRVNKDPWVFAYIISTVGRGYRLLGCVPWVTGSRVFFGPCKKKMRPLVRPGDYIMGISPAAVGKRRILLWMLVAETMTFADAYERGRDDNLFRTLRGSAVHVRPARGVAFESGNAAAYEHILGAPHPEKWRSDIRGERDVFLAGAAGSWVAESNAPLVDERLAALLQNGIDNHQATVHNPLGRYPRGKHALVAGAAARRIIAWMPKMASTGCISDAKARTSCSDECSCE